MTPAARRGMRAQELPIVGGLPDAPGILAVMNLHPGIGLHLRALADALLVDPFPGTTLSRGERELLATAVSLQNGCFFCADSHAAFATELLRRERGTEAAGIVERNLWGGTCERWRQAR
jgi:AhpD family alkylhydroperoxidase